MPHPDASPLQDLIDQALAEHAQAPQQAAQRLDEAAAHLPATADAAAWIRACEHVLLAHLDDAPALRRALARVTDPSDPTVRAALDRARLALAGIDAVDAAAPAGLPPPDQVRAWSTAASVHLLRQDWNAAAARVERASRIAAAEPSAARAYAALLNNLAVDLRVLPGALAPGAEALMLDFAARARAAWERAGGWLEVERAEYQLALCHARAGQGDAAVRHARACLAACEANGADAFERCFAQEARVHAHRAAGDTASADAALAAMASLVDAIEDADSKAYAAQALVALRS